MQNQNSTERAGRWWGSTLITLGVVLFAVVAFAAFLMIRDPGGYYDDWVPDDEIDGPEASYDWASSGLEVTFTDTSDVGDAAIERWQWDFGDGAVSDEPNPTHRFDEPGERNVTLDVVDANERSSQAEGTVELEMGEDRTGDGSIGLADMADKVVDSVDRAAKGGLVVVLVIGLSVVLTLIGGRLVRYGVRLLRPDPDKINVKLRPKELELAVADATEREPTVVETIEPPRPAPLASPDDERHETPVGV